MFTRQPIIITGPTTTGKSEISEIVARKINGAIINSDNYYFYANDQLRIGLGLAKDEPAKDIPSYLFGIRSLSQPKPDPAEFLQLVNGGVNDALQKGRIPIIQGCSFRLNRALIEQDITPHVFIPIWRSKTDLRNRCRARVKQMLAEGLLNEVKAIIDSGNDTSWIAREGIIYAPAIAFLQGQIQSEQKLIQAISDGIINRALEQEAKYKTLESAKITWICHQNDPEFAAEEILRRVKRAAV